MPIPTLEVFAIPASAAVRQNPQDPAHYQATNNVLAKTDGYIKTYYGIQHEDKSIICFVVAWETFQHHQNFMDNAVAYKDLISAISDSVLDTASSVPPKMYHVVPSSEPYKALDAPVLEIATFTLIDGQSKPALEALVNELEIVVNAQGEAAGVFHATAGNVVEKDNVVAIFIGWTTVEAHWDLVNNHPTIVDLLKKIKEIAVVELFHAPLTSAN